MSLVKMSSLNANRQIRMNSTSGTILATVVTMLMNAASRMPRSTSQCTAHKRTEAQMIETSVLPSPKAGMKSPAVENSSTK